MGRVLLTLLAPRWRVGQRPLGCATVPAKLLCEQHRKAVPRDPAPCQPPGGVGASSPSRASACLLAKARASPGGPGLGQLGPHVDRTRQTGLSAPRSRWPPLHPHPELQLLVRLLHRAHLLLGGRPLPRSSPRLYSDGRGRDGFPARTENECMAVFSSPGGVPEGAVPFASPGLPGRRCRQGRPPDSPRPAWSGRVPPVPRDRRCRRRNASPS